MVLWSSVSILFALRDRNEVTAEHQCEDVNAGFIVNSCANEENQSWRV